MTNAAVVLRLLPPTMPPVFPPHRPGVVDDLGVEVIGPGIDRRLDPLGEHPLKRRRTPPVRSTLQTTFVTLTGRPAGILGEKE